MPPPTTPKPSLINDPVHLDGWHSKEAIARRAEEVSMLKWKLENPNLNKEERDELWQRIANQLGFYPPRK